MRSFRKTRPVQFLGQPIGRFKTLRSLGVILDTRLTSPAHVKEVRKKLAQRLGVLSPLLSRRCGLYFRIGVLLYKQLMPFIMYYACPVWTLAGGSHFRKLQGLQSKCLGLRLTQLCTLVKEKFTRTWGYNCLLTPPPTSNPDWEFRFKFSWYGKSLVRQLVRPLCRSRSWLKSLRVTVVNWRWAGQTRLFLKRQPIRLESSILATRLHLLRCSMLFLSCKASFRV
jgi:hypothetical protein